MTTFLRPLSKIPNDRRCAFPARRWLTPACKVSKQNLNQLETKTMPTESKTARNSRGQSMAEEHLYLRQRADHFLKIRTNAGTKLNCIGDLVIVRVVNPSDRKPGNNITLELRPGVNRADATSRIQKTFSRGGEPVVFDDAGKANVKFSRITATVTILKPRKQRQRRAA